jgi:small conductance mechanosensitive channel
MRRYASSIAILILLLLPFGQTLAADEQLSPFEEEATKLLQQIDDLSADGRALQARIDAATGTTARVLNRRLEKLQLEALDTAHKFAKLVADQSADGGDAGEYKAKAVDLLQKIPGSIQRHMQELREHMTEFDKQAEEAKGPALAAIDAQRLRTGRRIDTLFNGLIRNIELSEENGIDTTEQKAWLVEKLTLRGQLLSIALAVTLEEVDILRTQIADFPDDADLQGALKIEENRVRRLSESLENFTVMVEPLDLDVSEYRQQLIETTGAVTTDLLDLEVLQGLVGRWFSGVGEWLGGNLPQLLFKLLVLLFILWVARALSRLARKVVTRAIDTSGLKVSRLLRNMIISTAANFVLLLGILIALAQMGFSVGPLLAGLGIAGFIVGFALQDTLSNFASGMMILFYRPFDVGDLIETGGVFGKVSSMSLVNTTVLTLDHQTLVIPNSKIWGDVIKNVTAQRMRRVDLVFGISYTDDIPKAEKIMEEILESHPKILKDPEPVVKLHTLGESSVDFVVRPWVKTDDYWDIHWDVTRAVKMRFDEEGISIPFPQRDVHVFYETPPKVAEEALPKPAGAAPQEPSRPTPLASSAESSESAGQD